MSTTAAAASSGSNATFQTRSKPQEIRRANIIAARSVADAIRTSLGPKGMDKLIKTSKNKTIISNDGHTILKEMAILHPVAKMLVEVSKAQDIEAGDGTTSVVILTGSLLGACEKLLGYGIHPMIIAEAFQVIAQRCVQILSENLAMKIDLNKDYGVLVRAAVTSLSSKIVNQFSSKLGPLAVDCVLKLAGGQSGVNVDLNNIRLIKKLGGTIDDTELIDGVALTQTSVKLAGGPIRMEKAKIGLIQFQISPPKPDTQNNIVVNDYRQMDKILKEERAYLLNICKKIKKSKCNVLLIQKSILRDSVNDMALHFLAKLKIMVVKDIERDEVEFLSKSLGCKPIADIDLFTEDRLGSADLIDEIDSDGSRILTITGIKGQQQQNSSNSGSTESLVYKKYYQQSSEKLQPTVSVIIRGANQLILDEAERSIHDALCVVRCLVKQPALLPGGGSPEINLSRILTSESNSLTGSLQQCYQEFAKALEIIPVTLSENSGMNAIKIITELKNKNANGLKYAGLSCRRSGVIDNVVDEHILQPLLVSTSAITLASECCKSILRIDDITFSR
ncbi:T-complex protein 1 [Hanseniaspora valbyensis NRRL Y-1626]|uniref:T-complex protein 1 subunit delta n=1 Tax=Hanseniaspora valbyensis NRRL Y-1626 TaxID=766949 RepID=A0A1B7TBL5_9ASCO|nr:T-complex protein 1 [Hanseniaspora valbyensis NRRL Y-1626]